MKISILIKFTTYNSKSKNAERGYNRKYVKNMFWRAEVITQ